MNLHDPRENKKTLPTVANLTNAINNSSTWPVLDVTARIAYTAQFREGECHK